jgi:uncharacterized protein (TIGR00730 family)
MKKIAVFCSANNNIDPRYFEKARELGKWIGESNYTLVYGGCDMGLMECLAQAVHNSKGQVIGVVPTRVEKNGHTSKFLDIEIPCQDLTDRKALMMAQSDVIVALPGGIGTLDEIFTVAAASTIGYADKKVILYNIDHFWDQLMDLLHSIEKQNFMREPASRYFTSVGNFEELKREIEAI